MNATSETDAAGIFGQVFSARQKVRETVAPSVGYEELPMDKDSRIKRLHQPYWIGYDAAIAARKKIERVLDMPYSDRITSCAIIAPSFNGKTSILRNIQRRHNILPEGFRGDALSIRTNVQIPIFFVQAPPMPDEDRLLDAILRQLHMLGSPREPAEHKISRIQSMFAGLGVRMLEIDEFGFFQAGSPDKQRKALNGLKYLGNELKIPIILASVEEGLNILTSNSEISNRYPTVQLPKWHWKNEVTLSMLASIESKLGLKKESNLGTMDMAKHIVSNADSLLGHMHDLIKLLAEKAIDSGKEQITIEDLTPKALGEIGWVLPSLRHQRAS